MAVRIVFSVIWILAFLVQSQVIGDDIEYGSAADSVVSENEVRVMDDLHVGRWFVLIDYSTWFVRL